MSTLAPVTARLLDDTGVALAFMAVGISRYFAMGLTFFTVLPRYLLKGVVMPLVDEEPFADILAMGLREGSWTDKTVTGLTVDV